VLSLSGARRGYLHALREPIVLFQTENPILEFGVPRQQGGQARVFAVQSNQSVRRGVLFRTVGNPDDLAEAHEDQRAALGTRGG
jgi:hypothetical protein